MKWHESQNLKSKSVAEYVSKFITKKQNARVYKFVKMINSRIGYDPSSKFRHVSDHLFKKNIKEIKSEFKWEEEFESADLKYDLIYAELPINLRTDEKFVFDGGNNFFSNPNVIALIVELSGNAFFGIKHLDIEEKISSFGFLPISYDPFTQKVNTLDAYNVGGNSIYVKNIDDAVKRCLESESFCVHTANDLII